MPFQDLSIKSQLRMASLIPMLLVTVIFVLFCTMEFTNTRKQQISHVGEAYIKQLLPVAQWAILQNNHQMLQTLIEASSVNQDLESLAFYNQSGQLLAYRGQRPPLLLNHRKSHRKKNQEIIPYHLEIISPIRIQAFSWYTPFSALKNTSPINNKPDYVIGYIVMTIDTTGIWIQQYRMILITLFISLITLITGLLIHYFLSKEIYRPIARLRRCMKSILNNAFDTPIPHHSTGELGTIEAGCNHLQKKYLNTLYEMNHSIDTATQDLQKSHELLEEKNIQLMMDKRKSEEKHKQKSALISNLSHEIRTPLNGIIGFSNLLLDSHLPPLEMDYAKTIKNSAQDLVSIINDILDYSKIEACKLQLDSIPLDIRTCIDEVCALSAPKAHKKGLDLIPSTALSVPQKVLGDPLRIKQIIINLVDNAIKFTEQGHVLLRTTLEQETDKDYTLCISVKDTGIGMTPDEQAVLFHPFHQADSSISRRFGGSGLGLIICKQLSETMHGKMQLVSEPNKGSTFSVYLKLDKLSAFEIEQTQPKRFGELTALCFDENSLYLEAISHGLGHFGMSCVLVTSLHDFEFALAQTPHDLAFVHWRVEHEPLLTTLLSKHNKPCILLSKSFIPHYRSLGASGFLFQPPNIHKLQETLESFTQSNTLTPMLLEQTDLLPLRQELASRHVRILIADDNLTNRRLLGSWLQDYVQLDSVEDGEQVVTRCNSILFDAILIDLHMPRLDGLMATLHVRQKSLLNQNTPVILISANSNDFHEIDLKKFGIQARLTKPIDERSLIQSLLTVLDNNCHKAIDWSMCVNKMSGNVAFAREYLIQFIEELHLARQDLLEYLHHHDCSLLEESAHKLHGACCFFGAPQLQESVAKLESTAKHSLNQDELRNQLSVCIEHIDLVLHESFKFDTTTQTKEKRDNA